MAYKEKERPISSSLNKCIIGREGNNGNLEMAFNYDEFDIFLKKNF